MAALHERAILLYYISMFGFLRSVLAMVGAVGIALTLLAGIEYVRPDIFSRRVLVYEAPKTIVESFVEIEEEKSLPVQEEFTPAPPPPPDKPNVAPVAEQESAQVVQRAPDAWEVSRVKNPYGIPERSFDEINTNARAALVNVFCNANGSLSPITASGVFISAQGVILTNAHVAQYLLLEETKKVNLHCVIRTGAPAYPRYIARILFIPPEWVREHAHELTSLRALGTGEHDWALLYIDGTTNNSPLPESFPYLPPDVRSAIGFTGDLVLAASYPAGFIDGITVSMNLYSASAPTKIMELMTFASGSADIFSIGGTVTAQSGSSGGAVVNMWGYLIGLITTMKEGETTAERDLRAISLNYVNSDLKAHAGVGLASFASGNLAQKSAAFMATEGNALAELLLEQLK